MMLSVTPDELHPNAMFLRGMQASANVITATNGARIGYVSGRTPAVSINAPWKT